jgi:pilus assembly protein CpaF
MTLSDTQPVATTYDDLRRRAQERIAGANLDRDRDPEQVNDLVVAVVTGYQHEATSGLGTRPLRDPAEMITRLQRSILGYGPLEEYINAEEPYVEVEARGSNLMAKDPRGRWHTSRTPTSEDELRHVIDRLLEPTGRVLNEAQPIISTQVLNRQVRLTASIPPVSDQLELSLRFYRRRWEELDDLVAWDTLTPAASTFCWALMRHPDTGVLVSGRPQSGKTTLVNALLRAAPNSHVVRCVEDTRELDAPLMHISYRQTRPRSGLADGENEITLRDLVALALRASPTRIVVGEIRGEEAVELTRAGNAGTALLATIHSNSASGALDALSNAALLGDHNMSGEAVRSSFAEAIDVVIHLDSEDVELRGGDPDRPIRRQVMEIAAVSPFQGGEQRFTTIPIFARDELGAPLLSTGHPVPQGLARALNHVLHRHGTTLQGIVGQEATGR